MFEFSTVVTAGCDLQPIPIHRPVSMEKYRQFAHAGTGVNPFVAATSNYRSVSLSRAARFAVLGVIFPVRALLLLVAVAGMVLGEGISWFFFLIPPVLFPVRRFFFALFGRVALLSLGVVVRTREPDARRLKLRPPLTGSTGRGEVVLCPLQSVVDVILLATVLGCDFAFVALDGSVRRCGFSRALVLASADPAVSFGQNNRSQISSSRAPTCLFLEGARTNGLGALSFPSKGAVVDLLDAEARVGIAAVRYSGGGATAAPHTSEPVIQHLCSMMLWWGHWGWYVRLSGNDAVAAVPSKPRVTALRPLYLRVRGALGSVVDTDLSAATAVKFLQYVRSS